jgi:TonB family protein
VILNSQGKLQDLQIVERSGSQSMDGTLLEALRAAAFDPNPPPDAATDDGTYEFIFRAQVLASVASGRLQRVESRLQVGLN